MEKKYFVEICENEYEINVLRDGTGLLSLVHGNDPTTVGMLELDAEDAAMVDDAFKDPEVFGYGVPWNKYCEDLGYKKFEPVLATTARVEGKCEEPRGILASLPADGIDLNDVIGTIENYLVDQALARTGGNKNKASKLLGLNRTTLVEKLRKRGMIQSKAKPCASTSTQLSA